MGLPFSYQITTSSPATSYGANTLPGGLTLDSATGLISGTPVAPGTNVVNVTATNADGTGSLDVRFTMHPAGAPPAITSPGSASGVVGTVFSYTITASNNPISYGAAPLPAGLNVNALTGLISGIPAAAGATAVTLSAMNANGTGTAVLSMTISPPVGLAPVITSPASAETTVGQPFSYTIAATNSPTSFSAAPLPAGLTVNAATGLISGTAAAAGLTPVVLSATNASGTGTLTLNLKVDPAAAPGAPVLSGSAASDNAIQWSWTAATLATGYRLVDANQNNISGPLAPTVQAFTEKGLNPNTAYTRQVIASNGASQTPSAWVTRYTLARAPSQVRLIDVGVSSATVSWQPNGNPSGTAYKLIAQDASGFTLNQQSASSPATLQGLSGATAYSLQLVAVNGDGLTSAAAAGGPALRFVTAAGAESVTISNAQVAPNPLRPAKGDSEFVFSQLPPGSTLEVYTLLGEKVQTLTADGTGRARWDGNNSNGRPAASGVYFVLIKSGGDHRTLKVAIQR